MREWLVPIRGSFTAQRDALPKMRSALEAADERVRVLNLSIDDADDLVGALIVTAERPDAVKGLAQAAIDASLPHGPENTWEIGDPAEWAPED
jgi:hypothetical protein